MEMRKPRVILRADGNQKMGLGHVFRLIALSAFLDQDFRLVFYIRNPSQQLLQIIASAVTEFKILGDEIPASGYWADEILPSLERDDILVLDGYHFDYDYQQRIKEMVGCKLVSIDDIYQTRFVSDVVINHIGGINPAKYDADDRTNIFLGPAYAILRNEFQDAALSEGRFFVGKDLFINLGGADPFNNTLEILSEIRDVLNKFEHVYVVVGGAYLYIEELKVFAAKYTNLIIRMNVSAKEMIDIMTRADVAICSASTVAYEYCTIKGALFVVQSADNQVDMVKFLVESGLAMSILDFANWMNDSKRTQRANALIDIQQKIFDGKAGQRILKIFRGLLLRDNIIMRTAVPGDVDLYFEWANDAEVRANSFNSVEIPYSDHCKWFTAKMEDAASKLYVFTTGSGIPVGNVRIERLENTGTISYSVDNKYRGLGVAKSILTIATREFFNIDPAIETIQGYVKGNNAASLKVFRALHYQESIDAESHDHRFFITRHVDKG
jgi:UDP-2,4-diacetamido-2,4,6-trideoxy-beta-L-altropyranose hydrolase